MVWHLLLALYCVNRNDFSSTKLKKSIATYGLVVYGVLFSMFHIKFKTTTAFQVHFISLLAFLLIRMHYRFKMVDVGETGNQLVTMFTVALLSAFGCWLLDYHGCSWVSRLPINPHGHMWWHFLISYVSYSSIVLFRIFEEAEVGKQLEIKYRFGIPFAYKSKSDIEPAGQMSNSSSQLF